MQGVRVSADAPWSDASRKSMRVRRPGGDATPGGRLEAAYATMAKLESTARDPPHLLTVVRPPQVIMPTANSPASKEVVTAALLVIGGKILSGRTKDRTSAILQNISRRSALISRKCGWSATRRERSSTRSTRSGIAAVFTTGGIGPTHGDITAACVAKAFGVPIDTDPRALAILHKWVKTTGAEMNEARLRMTRLPKGADLILNKVSGGAGLLDRQRI